MQILQKLSFEIFQIFIKKKLSKHFPGYQIDKGVRRMDQWEYVLNCKFFTYKSYIDNDS